MRDPGTEGPDSAVQQGATSPNGRLYLLLTLHFPAIAIGIGNGIILPSLPGLAKSFDVSVG